MPIIPVLGGMERGGSLGLLGQPTWLHQWALGSVRDHVTNYRVEKVWSREIATTHTYACTHTHSYTCIYIHTHICTHTHTPRDYHHETTAKSKSMWLAKKKANKTPPPLPPTHKRAIFKEMNWPWSWVFFRAVFASYLPLLPATGAVALCCYTWKKNLIWVLSLKSTSAGLSSGPDRSFWKPLPTVRGRWMSQ